MSHIVTGTTKIRLTDTERLRKAMAEVGLVREQIPLYRVGVGFTSERWPLVVVDPTCDKHRLGFRQINGDWKPYLEEMGSAGQWARDRLRRIEDFYVAHEYAERLRNEGYETRIYATGTGGVEVLAEEPAW